MSENLEPQDIDWEDDDQLEEATAPEPEDTEDTVEDEPISGIETDMVGFDHIKATLAIFPRKVARHAWSGSGKYLIPGKDGLLLCSKKKSPVVFVPTPEDLTACDWYIIKEEKPE